MINLWLVCVGGFALIKFYICNLIILIMFILLILNNLFYLQSDGYIVESYIVSYMRRNKYILMLHMPLIVFNLLFAYLGLIKLIFYNILFVVAILINLIVLFIDIKIGKLKFTKRIYRIFFVSIFLLLIFCILFYVIGLNFLFLFVLFSNIFIPIILSLALLVLQPIELIIKNKYIRIARNILSRQSGLIKIGITGSYGKTSVKEILNSILVTTYFTVATPKSFNTPFGLTKTIISDLLPLHEVFIAEMGAKKKGEIHELCKIINVDYGIVTAVGRQHTNTFGSVDNIYKTKKELPDYLENKFCVFNLMNTYVSKMYRGFVGEKIGVFILKNRELLYCHMLYIKKKVSIATPKRYLYQKSKISKLYEFNKLNNVYAKNILLSCKSLKFDIYYSNKFVASAESQLIGIHNVINILLATAMALKLNVTGESIKLGISNLKSINARFDKKTNNNGAVIINNGYNSNLDSAKYSLQALNVFNQENKIVITPGLIDCIDSYKYNYEFGKMLSKYCTHVFIVKKINRKAIIDGLIDGGFDKSRIGVVDNFKSLGSFINNATGNDVILIENDLPENFK